MRNDDIIFVANAASVDATKFLTFVNLVTSTAVGTETAVQGVPITSAVVHGHELAAAPSKTLSPCVNFNGLTCIPGTTVTTP